ncbi:CatB-related O-acetyltransferase [Clostridium perfringens]|nr:CatB-related O-acetyltransferase [Clostridium perfringens]
MDKKSYTGNNCSIIDAEIGKYCSIASYCCIGGGKHPINWVSTSPVFYNNKNSLNRNSYKKEFADSNTVKIGNDVWIGEKVFIKSGISIGNGAIIGANSVVTKNVPDYAVVAGCPAKIIKYRFSEEIIDELLKIKWWDIDDDILKNYIDCFDNVSKFIKLYNKNVIDRRN